MDPRICVKVIKESNILTKCTAESLHEDFIGSGYRTQKLNALSRKEFLEYRFQ